MERQKFWIVLLLIFTIVVSILALVFKPQAVKVEPIVQPKLVRTVTARISDEQIMISAFGTIQANREVTIRPQVSGRVIDQSENLVIGGFLKKNEVLLQLDPRDYEYTVEQEKAAVERAEFDLQVEEGRQVVAKREWEELQPSIKPLELSEELVLRKPHLREKKAALEAAKSRLAKAKLDLRRTVIRSPMDGIVLSETIEVGDYVTPQSEIAKVAATDEFRVQVSVPVNKLQWINEGSKVRVIQNLGSKTVEKEGRILRLLGDLDPGGRMARLLVAIEDPLGLKASSKHIPFLIGTFIQVEITGPKLPNVFVIPREALHEENKVWIKNKNNQLDIRTVNVIQKNDQTVTIENGINEGEEIIISNLPIAIPGMELRTVESEEKD